ncbi:hypothetical protein M407DRAFT_8174 [Tulasnella calospora MUT 4182]|uniref:SWI5-dependent HO expression protein 3 n=1 Tax=Tulasnella calospora MUT 4182 TaxID=1051891 RepID=A0A0C3Q819_9AGAM|nr:hypothetical protein M407DRAFT_8174 [Tulasnella calospora MUT 4182]
MSSSTSNELETGIPVSAVGNARALAEENGRPRSVSPLPPLTPSSATPMNGDTSFDLGSTSLGSLLPSTPSTNGYKRMSMGAGGGTSKVLSDLQNAAVHARTALDNTRQQLRVSQRSVASLTRQVEDLKDGRERLRLENESLNNVVSRKERLLQEVLERARKAEAEAQTLKTQLKTEAANAKKSVSTVTEAVAQSQKAQREYTTLRDSITGMTEGWKKEVKDLQDQMRKRDEAWREEVKEVTVKHNSLVKLVKATRFVTSILLFGKVADLCDLHESAERSKVEALKTEGSTLDKQFEEAMRAEIKKMSAEVTRSTEDAERATQQAQGLADELARLRRLMRAAGATKLPNAEDLA